MTREQAKAYRSRIERAASTQTDADALDSVDLFPAWQPGTSYAAGRRIRDGGRLFRCVMSHVSPANWHPAQTPALWVRVSIEEWPEWIQPRGAHDAYNAGDKCSYNGGHYVCAADGNVYAPDVWGWEAR